MRKIVTQSDYTSALVSKRNDLADNIDTMGVEAEQTEKLNTLVPKVLEIGGEGGRSRLDETKINVMREGDPKLYTFATIADAVTFIDSTDILKYVIIGSDAGVTSIDDNAFNGCTSLASISMPDSVTSIGDYAFLGCTSLASIVIPDSVTSIGDGAFGGYTPLRSITIPNSVTSIGDGAFEDSSLESITIPSGITNISEDAFSNCKSLRNVYMGSSSVTSIGNYAFNGCESLISITIPDGVTNIGNAVFNGCASLSSIIIPESVTGISGNAFTGCDILILDSYKSRTGYPWGATDILIHNEDVTTTVSNSSTDRQVPTAKAVYDALAGSAVDAYTKTETDALLDEKLDVSDALTLGETSTTAYAGNKGKANADAIAAIKDGTNIDSFADVETALADKVDKVSGKGLSTNDFTNTDKANLATALTKANAAAPQAATYTKFEVDQALSRKLGPSDVDTTLSSTSTKPVQNKVIQAPIARLVDAGTKNLLKITETSETNNGVTFTVNSDGTVTANGTASTAYYAAAFNLNTSIGLESGSYVLSGCPSGGSSNTYCLTAGSIGVSGTDYGNSVHISGAVTGASIQVRGGTTVNNLTFKPMICTAEDYAISHEFVPYAKSNYELTQATEPIPRLVDAGAKNLLKNERCSGATVTWRGATWVFSEDTMEVIASGTVGTTWSDVYILNAAIDLSDKEYIVVVQSDAETMFAYLPGNTITGGNIPTNGQYYPGTYRFKGIITTDARFTARTGTLNNNFLRVMICTAEDYAISPEYVPYCPTLRELYETKADIIPVDRQAIDLNTTVDPGVYRFYGENTTNLPSDIPSSTPYGLLEVVVCGRYIKQTLTRFTSTSPAVYIRSGLDSGDSWSTWGKVDITAVT